MGTTKDHCLDREIVYDEERGGWRLTEEGQWMALQEQVERAQQLDAQDVRKGLLPLGFFHFIPRSMIEAARLTFPNKYEPPMSATPLFLDTEWADLNGTQLVSLALVNQDGQRKLYVERDPLPPPGSEFVEHVVYPLLERGPSALPDAELVERVRAFLARFQSPVVIADHPNDHALLGRIMSSASPPVDWVPIFMDQSDVRGHVEAYFERRPEARRLRHHAAVDAEALRWAWCYVNEGVG